MRHPKLTTPKANRKVALTSTTPHSCGVKRYRLVPKPHLEDLSSGRKEALPGEHDNCPPAVFGVITYIINDARAGEFDDCPAI